LAVNASNIIPIASIIPAVVATGTPTIGAIEISEIRGKIDVYPRTVSGGFYVTGLGLYMADYDDNSGLFHSQFPLLAADATRDNWTYLNVLSRYVPSGLTSYVPPMTFSFDLKKTFTIEQGFALLWVINNANVSPDAVLYISDFRWKQRRLF